MSILPDVPRLPSARNKIADFIFVLLFFCSRFAFIIGGVVGALLHGFSGCLIGLVVGAAVGFCTSRSLGASGRDMTYAFYHRMHVRGTGRRAGQLEAFVEAVRGSRLSMMQCRQIACAYAEAGRQLQSCDSREEREWIIAKRNEQILQATYIDRRPAVKTSIRLAPKESASPLSR
jgi:hypothetical protein